MSYKLDSKYMNITRFCTKQDVVISGLFSKMLKHIIRTTEYHGKVISFSDNRHSNGNLYKECGFQLDKELPPDYFYTKDYHSRLNKTHFRKEKIAKKFNIDITGKTEWELMQELGYDRIWDAGKKRWVLEV